MPAIRPHGNADQLWLTVGELPPMRIDRFDIAVWEEPTLYRDDVIYTRPAPREYRLTIPASAEPELRRILNMPDINNATIPWSRSIPGEFDLPADLEGRSYEQTVVMRLSADLDATTAEIARLVADRLALNADVARLRATAETIRRMLRIASAAVDDPMVSYAEPNPVEG